MSSLFANGSVVDLILTAVVIEALALLFYRSKSGRGVPPIALLTNLLAGACLLLALRSALVGQEWYWVAIWLAFALSAHIADLSQRWRN